ncbi:unnamed protein product [Arabis nemorensis]|uniref:Uncharacterized protein n=1 Tax=Arabis nemorensis TaxID=586526 RepID=A0A565CC85_9BRAS|nr:unnamed protein product [Arabis nemorensis]
MTQHRLLIMVPPQHCSSIPINLGFRIKRSPRLHAFSYRKLETSRHNLASPPHLHDESPRSVTRLDVKELNLAATEAKYPSNPNTSALRREFTQLRLRLFFPAPFHVDVEPIRFVSTFNLGFEKMTILVSPHLGSHSSPRLLSISSTTNPSCLKIHLGSQSL